MMWLWILILTKTLFDMRKCDKKKIKFKVEDQLKEVNLKTFDDKRYNFWEFIYIKGVQGK